MSATTVESTAVAQTLALSAKTSAAEQTIIAVHPFDDAAEPFMLPGGHHQVFKDQSSGTDIHVFSFAGPPIYTQSDDNTWEFNSEFPVGPVTFLLRGSLDLDTD
ncbi:hypothetical protein M422DRAFT_51183 [Sphaerobolus stellatus SS14]|uniref:Uncharacterized protein n=1 Tax=Sphaerobolus stellatus (strain SS14) TaxID=990650 RepID=A0A0C9UMN9_SPHS4|nr:hypothetical protein M422DRAFT_51183 [Sphaerobolus stellatus SS14]